MYIGNRVQYSLFRQVLVNFFFRTDCRKILKYQILWKSVYWKVSWSLRMEGRIDGQTDRHNEASSRFS